MLDDPKLAVLRRAEDWSDRVATRTHDIRARSESFHHMISISTQCDRLMLTVELLRGEKVKSD